MKIVAGTSTGKNQKIFETSGNDRCGTCNKIIDIAQACANRLML